MSFDRQFRKACTASMSRHLQEEKAKCRASGIGSATHAGGDRQYDASIVRIVIRRLVLQFGGSKIRCILTLRAFAC